MKPICDRTGCNDPAQFAVRGHLWGVPLVCAAHSTDEPPHCTVEPIEPHTPERETGWVVFKKCWWWRKERQLGVFFTYDEAMECIRRDMIDSSFVRCRYRLQEIELR